MALAKGDFLLLLNPDTLLTEDCFGPQIAYMRENPKVAITIPKVLNSDGSFQHQSRRGDARPAEVFGYFLKLGKLFKTEPSTVTCNPGFRRMRSRR